MNCVITHENRETREFTKHGMVVTSDTFCCQVETKTFWSQKCLAKKSIVLEFQVMKLMKERTEGGC
jgi:hypothetical protein